VQPVHPALRWAENAADLSREGRRSLVVIGNFDGVHRGHYALVSSAVSRASAGDLVPVVLTFEPHPAVVVGRTPPPCLTNVARKVNLLREIDPTVRVVVQPFDKAFADQSPEAFVDHLLVRDLDAAFVVVGQNFRFGKARAGDLATLEALCAQRGIEVRAHDLVGDGGGRWSSTRARRALADGDLDDVKFVLGRPHGLEGVVIEGQKRARTIGFPTANLGGVIEALPPWGVHAVRVWELDQPGDHGRLLGGGVANIGVRPTVAAGFAVEAHVFDFEGDLYGKRLRVDLIARLRGEERFADFAALTAQIARDAERARKVLATSVA
jgi:riboflavin kinase / FMN adenylyltransferase